RWGLFTRVAGSCRDRARAVVAGLLRIGAEQLTRTGVRGLQRYRRRRRAVLDPVGQSGVEVAAVRRRSHRNRVYRSRWACNAAWRANARAVSHARDEEQPV